MTERSRTKTVDYVPVEMIQLSQTRETDQPPVLRPSAPVKEQPRVEPSPEPPKEKEMGMDKTGEEIPQPSPLPPQTVYLPQHRVTRVPNFKTQVKPVYPRAERAAGVEARVIVEAYINEYGGVDDVKIVKSAGRFFDEAVISAVKDSSFTSGYLEGRPVAVKVQIPYAFKLR
jgi:TonB family protein